MRAWTKRRHLAGKPGSMWSTTRTSGSLPSSTAPSTSASWSSTTARTTWYRRNRGDNGVIPQGPDTTCPSTPEVFILKIFKVVCFVTHLEVLILEELEEVEEGEEGADAATNLWGVGIPLSSEGKGAA